MKRYITTALVAAMAVAAAAGWGLEWTDPTGRVRPGEGWTDLVITPERGVWAVDGLISGWHDPEASHLMLVEAVAGRTTFTLELPV